MKSKHRWTESTVQKMPRELAYAQVSHALDRTLYKPRFAESTAACTRLVT